MQANHLDRLHKTADILSDASMHLEASGLEANEDITLETNEYKNESDETVWQSKTRQLVNRAALRERGWVSK